MRAAAVAAAAALGVMVGLGLRGVGSAGWTTALARLAVVALRLRGLPEFVTPDRDGGGTAVYGGLHVAVVAAIWGTVIGATERMLTARHAPRAYAAAAVVGVTAGLVSADTFLPMPARLAAGTLTGTEWVLMVTVIASGAWIGARSAEHFPAADHHDSDAGSSPARDATHVRRVDAAQ